MPSERSHALPAAILAGSTIIGICLYLGLREGLRPEPAPPPAATTVSPPAPASPSQAPPQKRFTLQREPVANRVYRQAQAGLDALRPELVKTCWTPPAEGEPTAITLSYDITFGADGGIITLGISDARDAYRISVADCVRKQPLPRLPVDPPGENVRVVLELHLP